MKYLVTFEAEEGQVSVEASEEAAHFLEHAVVPSIQSLTKWENEGKLDGGLFSGERGGAFIIEASSHEEVGKTLRSLPFWSFCSWDVTALQSFPSALEQDREVLQHIRKMATA